MADIHGSPADAPQMPAVAGSGPAPVPYAGAGLSPEPPDYAAALGPLTDAAGAVMAGVTGLGTAESPVAHDVNAGAPDAPYFPGHIDPIFAGGDDDPGGRSDVAGDVSQAVANATARWQELQSDTFGQGSVIGDLMTLAPVDSNPAVGDNAPWGPFPAGEPPSGSYT